MNGLLALLGVLLRRGLALTAVALILLALYVSLGRQLVPLVAEYRLEVEGKAQQALGMPIAIGRLEGRWHRLLPELIAHDVTLGEGPTALRLDRLSLLPDVAESLWQRDVRLRAVELAGAQLRLLEDADGNWRVDGLPRRADSQPADLQKLLADLNKLRHVTLRDSLVTLQAQGQAPLTFSYANLALQAVGDRVQLQGRVNLPDGKPLALKLDVRVNRQRWQDSDAEAYLDLPQSDWAAWWPPGLVPHLQLEQVRMGGEVWLRWREQSLARGVARLQAPRLQIGRAGEPALQVNDLTLNLYAERAPSGYRLQVEGLAFDLGEDREHRWPETAALLQQNAGDGSWSLQLEQAPIGLIAEAVTALAPLPETATDYLTGLAPSGTLHNLQLDYRPAAAPAERVAFAANLEAVSIAAHRWIPAARNVTGSIRGSAAGGELRFDNRDFSLHLAELFPAPWDYSRSRGSLTWTFDEQALSLRAPYLRLEGEEGSLAGDFLIRLMRDPDAEDYMDLRVGLSEGDARYTEKYLPTRSPALSAGLTEWLTTAIRGGHIEQGFFQYQGALNRGAPPEARNLSLYFKVRDAELAFQPGWPMLREGRGEVLIERSGVRVRIAEARMLDSRVRDATAEIALGQPATPRRLAIKGAVEGGLADGLTLLQVAPIGTAQTFAGWKGEGELNANLDLDIPLGKGERPRVLVDFSSQGAALYLAQPDLRIEQLAGDFRFDSERGLSASEISGQLFGQTLRGKASAAGKPGSPATLVEAQGKVAVPELASWLNIQRSLPVSGTLPFLLRLTLDGQNSGLELHSSLQGAQIELPAPFEKSARLRRDTTLRMSLAGERRRYSLVHGDVAALAFQAPAGAWREGGGELVLGGGAANLIRGSGLHVRGSLPGAELAAWQAVLKQYGKGEEDQAATGLLKSARVRIDTFRGLGMEAKNLDLDLRRAGAAWTLGLNSELVAGNVRLPDVDGAPIRIDLRHLRLPAAGPERAKGSERDPLEGVDPSVLPAMDIAVARVLQGEVPLGAWSLKLRPAAGGVAFSAVDLDLKGLRVRGSGGWASKGSWYKGRIEGGNLADVLLAWGFAPSTTSESFHLDADGRWPGSPAFFGLKRYSGTLDASLRKGQLREVDGSAQALRVFGLLNFDSIGRRLRLDFSDLFAKGLSYDRLKGELRATDGVFLTQGPITVTGPSSNLELEGKLDMVNDRIDAMLLVTLPVSNNLPLAALIVGAPAIGGALFIVDKLLGDRVARFASVQYKVQGPWQSPEISFHKPFEKSGE